MLHLSKKSDLFKPQDILKALADGPQSNEDNTSIKQGFVPIDLVISDLKAKSVL